MNRTAEDLLEGQVSACGICGYGGLKPLLDMGDQPLAEALGSSQRYPLILMECTNCSLVQLSHVVPRRVVFPPDHPYATGNTRALRVHFADLAEAVTRDLQSGDMVVDIGANDGTLLGEFAAWKRDLRLVAVEPTNQARKCEQKGIITYQQFFTPSTAWRIVETYSPAAVVTATNVLAHVTSVHDFMDGVQVLTAPGGVFITENHDLASITDGLQIDTIYHEHLRYFSIASLSRLLVMHGFLVDSVEKIPTHGGSFRVTARKRQTGLAIRAQEAATALRELLETITDYGGIVYGVGATTRATPLIHYAGIARHISAVAEVAESEKIGHLMPGTTIPVVDEAEMIDAQPEYALLFAWHIAATLMPKLRMLGYKGKFIIPLPHPEVTDD